MTPLNYSIYTLYQDCISTIKIQKEQILSAMGKLFNNVGVSTMTLMSGE